ncbi:MAG: glycosyltransferase [Ginsengibacter sp.]
MHERIPKAPPEILPVTKIAHRPLFSVMIPSYNCIKYLKYTLESVLAQDPGRDMMQIEVIDDCSTDGDVAALVNQVGKGRVSFFKQPENRGSLRNFETCLNRSYGLYIHLLHGDDLVKQGFYEEIKNLVDKYAGIGSAITNFNWIDENEVESPPSLNLLPTPGILNNWLQRIASRQMVQPPAVVVKREVYEKLGGFFAVHYGEDWEMWIRIASKYKVAYSPKCLATYRGGHNSNISTRSILSGENFRDLSNVIDIVQNYLPIAERKKLKHLAKKNFSISYSKSSYKLYKKHHANKSIAFLLASGALKFNINIRSAYWISRLFLAYCGSFFKPISK